MPEHLNLNRLPQTYDDVLQQHPAMHPDLRAHVLRLAGNTHHNPATIHDLSLNLDVILRNASGLSLEQIDDVKSGYEQLDLAGSRDITEYAVINYIDRLNRVDRSLRQREQELVGDDAQPQNKIGLNELGLLPEHLMQKVYFSEHGGALRELLTRSEDPVDIETSLGLLKVIHRYPGDKLSLLDRHNRYQDPTLQAMYTKQRLPESIIESSEFQMIIGESGSATTDQNNQELRNWARKYLENLTDLPKDRIDDMLHSSYERVEDKGVVDKDILAGMLLDTAEKARVLGGDTVVKLHEYAGIVDLDYAVQEQLELMSKFIDNDPETIEHLQAGDVTALFVDSKGDPTGALDTTSEVFATPNNRTLFFQINRPSDAFRHFALMKKRGIQPSTLVISNHGLTGSSSFNRDNEAFYLVNDEFKQVQKPSNQYSYAEMESLPRIVNEYMRDSRGIDDNTEAVGRRRIIFDSCKQAAPASVNRTTEAQAGAISQTQTVLESQAETVVKKADNPKLDVYAGADYLASHGTSHGVEFYRTVDDHHVDIPIKHFKLDTNGQVISDEMSELPLRAR